INSKVFGFSGNKVDSEDHTTNENVNVFKAKTVVSVKDALNTNQRNLTVIPTHPDIETDQDLEEDKTTNLSDIRIGTMTFADLARLRKRYLDAKKELEDN
ncbi:hypothetical protein ACFLQG_01005, partial [Candidatus Zixiibacteriota bacterium]